jgi:DMSO/TMAO reductase YedYZ molybdopterin-dependent catalytic subunit
LPPIVAPTRPAKIPQTNQLDETTGMHMTGIVQQLDLSTYRLKVSGMVDHPLSLTLDELRCMPKVTATPLLACGDLFKDSAEWGGVPIVEILNRAGVQAGAKTITLLGADEYSADIALAEALKPQNYLAYEWEGQPVPILHGFPLRAIFPDIGGWAWVKWLVEIDVK